MHDYRKLDVWRLSRRLARRIYEVPRGFPSDEQFGLTQQIRRASISVASNLAEGAGRGGGREFARFVRIATGSACELDTQLLIALDVRYLDRSVVAELQRDLGVIVAMLKALERSLTS